MSILIHHGIVLTVDPDDKVIQDGFVFIDGDRIVSVGSGKDRLPRNADVIIDAEQSLIVPGFINAHAHLTDSLVRSLGADIPLLAWLERLIWPFFAEADVQEICAGAMLGCLESIKSGTTTVIENYYSSKDAKANIDGLAEAVGTSGLRVALVRGYHDNPKMTWDIFVEDIGELLIEYERIIETWNGTAGGRLMTLLGPVDPLSSTPQSIKAVNDLARQYDVGMHTHVAETESVTKLIKEQYGARYVTMLNSLEVLGPHFSSAHAVWLDEEEMDILAERNSPVVHCPVSNMYLGAGIAPVPEMLSRGITVALGTDGACCNNTLDMFETVKVASLLHKADRCDPSALSAREVIRMGTINGARLLGLEHEIGSIEVGKKADLILVKVDSSHTIPTFDPYATLVYSCRSSDVDTVIVDGNILMEGRAIQAFDEGSVLQEAQQRATEIVNRVPALASLAR